MRRIFLECRIFFSGLIFSRLKQKNSGKVEFDILLFRLKRFVSLKIKANGDLAEKIKLGYENINNTPFVNVEGVYKKSFFKKPYLKAEKVEFVEKPLFSTNL